MRRLEITLSDSSQLASILRDADRLAKFRGDVFAGIASAPDNARKDLQWAALRMEQAARLSTALLNLGRVQNAAEVARWLGPRLSQPIDRLVTQDDPAQDRLFEVEMAGRLARSSTAKVWLGDETAGEPDVFLGDTERRIALELKRPKTAAGVPNLLRKGRKQLRRTSLPGVIVIGLEAIFHRVENPDDPNRRTIFYFTETPEEARDVATRLADSVVDGSRGQITDAFKEGIVGVLFCGIFTYMSRRPSAYSFRWIRRTVVNAEVDSAGPIMDFVQALLFDNRPEPDATATRSWAP